MCVPSASFGGFASAAWTFFRSVVSGRATVGRELKNTTESGWPGLRAANARAAAIADPIEPFMLFEASISRTVPMPSAEADDSTLRFLTGLPFSRTLTSCVVSAEVRLPGRREDVRAVGEQRAARLDDLDAVVALGSRRRVRDDRRDGGDQREQERARDPAHRRRSATFVGTGLV